MLHCWSDEEHGVKTMAPKGSAAAAESSSVDREGAEVVTGTEALSKFVAVLERFGFPAGLFPLPSLDEFGFVEKTGFFWIKHAGRHEHLFPMAKEVVVYMQDVSGRIQKGKMTALKGWKMKPLDHKDLFLSAAATEVWLDDPPLAISISTLPEKSPRLKAPLLSRNLSLSMSSQRNNP